MYTPASTTSVVDAKKSVNNHINIGVCQVTPSSRTSAVIGLLLCLALCTFNGAASFSIGYQTYYQYTPSFEMVPSLYNVDLLSLTSLSDAIKTFQDVCGYIVPAPKASSPSCSDGSSHCQKGRQDVVKIQHYNLALSTEGNYIYSGMHFEGKYKSIRSSLDYTYHRNYTPKRQLLQDSIITHILQKHNVNITDSDGNSCISPRNPWIVFTAGAMGSGKSYTIRHLAAKDRFPLESFVTVDPDEIRRLLPEFELYLDHSPEMAGEHTRKEAGFIAEILTQIALVAGRNVLVDGSLNDSDWYRNYFNILRRDHGNGNNLRIGILHITAPREAVFERAKMRSKITRRVVPRHRLEETLEKVPQSVKTLAPLVDFLAELHNAPHADDIELVSNSLNWNSFRSVWRQSCKTEDRIHEASKEKCDAPVAMDEHLLLSKM